MAGNPVMTEWLSRVNTDDILHPHCIFAYRKPNGDFTKCEAAQGFIPYVCLRQTYLDGEEYVMVNGKIEFESPHLDAFCLVEGKFPELDGNPIENETLCAVSGITTRGIWETHVVKTCVPENGTPYFRDTGVHEIVRNASGSPVDIVETDH